MMEKNRNGTGNGGRWLKILAVSIPLLTMLAALIAGFIEWRSSSTSVRQFDESFEKVKPAIKEICRSVANSVIEDNVERAHRIAAAEAAKAVEAHTKGLHAERLRQIERIEASQLRTESRIEQGFDNLREEIRQLRSEVRDN